MTKAPHNIAASVRARLLNLSRERGLLYDLLLTRYVLERLLYRLSTTAHRERFVLKGAMLLTTWFNDPVRPTRDLALLGFGDPDPEAMLAATFVRRKTAIPNTFPDALTSAQVDRLALQVSSLG